jgi:hypothetical protein
MPSLESIQQAYLDASFKGFPLDHHPFQLGR